MKKMLLNAALAFISILFALVAFEVGLRIALPQNLAPSYQTRDGVKILRPNHTGMYRGVETVQAYRINSFGMRDREHRLQKEPGTFRVLVLGDSFVEALQVRFEDSFAPRFEQALAQATGRPVDVISAGVSGWGTDDELAWLTRYGRRFRPDLVLVAMTMTNDVNDNLLEEFHYLDGEVLRERAILPIPFLKYKLWQIRAWLGSHSHVYQVVRRWWHAGGLQAEGQQLAGHVVEQLEGKSSPRLLKGWKLTFELFDRLNEVAKEMGAQASVFLIPISAQLDAEKREFDKPQRLMREFGSRKNLPVIDLLPCFQDCQTRRGVRLVLKEDGHWTEAGHAVAACALTQALTGSADNAFTSCCPVRN